MPAALRPQPRGPLWVVINGPDGPEIRLPLFPRKRTQVGHRAISVSCQQQTSANSHTFDFECKKIDRLGGGLSVVRSDVVDSLADNQSRGPKACCNRSRLGESVL